MIRVGLDAAKVESPFFEFLTQKRPKSIISDGADQIRLGPQPAGSNGLISPLASREGF